MVSLGSYSSDSYNFGENSWQSETLVTIYRVSVVHYFLWYSILLVLYRYLCWYGVDISSSHQLETKSVSKRVNPSSSIQVSPSSYWSLDSASWLILSSSKSKKMQKILILILATVSSGFVFNIGYTVWPVSNTTVNDVWQTVDNSPSAPTANKIFTSEKVPWASCVCVRWTDSTWKTEYDATGLACWGLVINRKYECTIPTGLAGFQSVFRDIVRVVINIVLLLSVLAVVGLGIAWSFAWGDDIKAKSTLKTWAINIVIWLFILFMFGYILSFLAPWVYR